MTAEIYDSDGFLIEERINEKPVIETNDEQVNEIKPCDDENKVIIRRTRISKYNNDDEKHEAIKAQKREWYWKHSNKQKLKSLKQYYQKQLAKSDLKEETKSKYVNKLNSINEELNK